MYIRTVKSRDYEYVQLAHNRMDARKKFIYAVGTIGGFCNFIKSGLDFVALDEFAGSVFHLSLIHI